MFSGWLKKESGIEEPTGLEAAKQKILGEAEETVGPLVRRGTNPQREGQPDLNKVISDVRGTKPPTPQPAASPEIERQSGQPAQNLDDANEIHQQVGSGVLSERQQLIGDFRSKLRESFDLEDDMVDTQMRPLRDSIRNIMATRNQDSGGSEDEMRDQFISLMALANTYDGRIRHGEGKRTMFYEDAQRLMDPVVQQSLLEGYGDGSPEQIEKFVNSRKVVDTPMADVNALWKVLPDKFKQALGSGSLGNSIKLLQDDGTIKNEDARKLHFGGDDNRVTNGSNLRKKLLLKLFLDQAGRDGYTGNELDPRYMELEHVRGVNNLMDGEVAPTLEQVMQRENLRNWLWIGTGVNNEKSDLDMKKFLENTQEKHSKMAKEDYIDLEASDKTFQERQSGMSSLLEDFIQNNEFTENATPDAIQALFDNELNESEAMHRNGIKKTPVQLGDKMRKALGMVKDRKLTRSQLKTQKELFRPLIMNALSLPPEERSGMIEKYNQLFHSAADRTAELSSMGPEGLTQDGAIEGSGKSKGKLNEKGTWEKMFYKSLADSGLITAETLKKHLQSKEFDKFNKLLFEGIYEEQDWVDKREFILL